MLRAPEIGDHNNAAFLAEVLRALVPCPGFHKFRHSGQIADLSVASIVDLSTDRW